MTKYSKQNFVRNKQSMQAATSFSELSRKTRMEMEGKEGKQEEGHIQVVDTINLVLLFFFTELKFACLKHRRTDANRQKHLFKSTNSPRAFLDKESEV